MEFVLALNAFAPRADIVAACRHVRFVPKAAVSNRSKADNLFDHLVGAPEHGNRQLQAKNRSARRFRGNPPPARRQRYWFYVVPALGDVHLLGWST
jgi:hypothetical protein